MPNTLTPDESYLKARAKEIKSEDIEKLIRHEKDIKDKTAQGPLKALFDEVRTLFEMLKDYRANRYRDVPFWVIATIAVALLYVFTPLDFVPDFILGFGLLDDASIISLCLMMIRNQLDDYRNWKEQSAEI